MQEWAAATTHAAPLLVVGAHGHAVLARHVSLLLKLVLAMGKGAGVAILAHSRLLPELAQLCLLLDLVVWQAKLALFVKF